MQFTTATEAGSIQARTGAFFLEADSRPLGENQDEERSLCAPLLGNWAAFWFHQGGGHLVIGLIPIGEGDRKSSTPFHARAPAGRAHWAARFSGGFAGIRAASVVGSPKHLQRCAGSGRRNRRNHRCGQASQRIGPAGVRRCSEATSASGRPHTGFLGPRKSWATGDRGARQAGSKTTPAEFVEAGGGNGFGRPVRPRRASNSSLPDPLLRLAGGPSSPPPHPTMEGANHTHRPCIEGRR